MHITERSNLTFLSAHVLGHQFVEKELRAYFLAHPVYWKIEKLERVIAPPPPASPTGTTIWMTFFGACDNINGLYIVAAAIAISLSVWHFPEPFKRHRAIGWLNWLSLTELLRLSMKTDTSCTRLSHYIFFRSVRRKTLYPTKLAVHQTVKRSVTKTVINNHFVGYRSAITCHIIVK